MQEHAAAQIADFEKKAGLDLDQCAAFELELESFDSRIREIAERYAVMVDGGMQPGFEMQARIMNEMSAAALDAYAGIGELVPGGQGGDDAGFNLMFGLSPDSLSPLFDSFRRSGAFMQMGGFGGFGRRGGPPAGGPRGGGSPPPPRP